MWLSAEFFVTAKNMQKYIQIYLDYFDYKPGEFIPCEVCKAPAEDVHHIHGRGKGKDIINNLIAVCRDCHNKAHSSKDRMSPAEFQAIHDEFLKKHWEILAELKIMYYIAGKELLMRLGLHSINNIASTGKRTLERLGSSSLGGF